MFQIMLGFLFNLVNENQKTKKFLKIEIFKIITRVLKIFYLIFKSHYHLPA